MKVQLHYKGGWIVVPLSCFFCENFLYLDVWWLYITKFCSYSEPWQVILEVRVSIKHHYSCKSFFGETICDKYLLHCRNLINNLRVFIYKTSLMSSSLLLQQGVACSVRFTLVVFEMGAKWPYSRTFVACWIQDLFKKAHRTLA